MISLNYITVSINPTVLTIITDKTIIAIITILIVDIYLYPQLDIYIFRITVARLRIPYNYNYIYICIKKYKNTYNDTYEKQTKLKVGIKS